MIESSELRSRTYVNQVQHLSMCRAASRRSLDAFSHAMNSGNLSVNRTLYESVQHNLPVFTQGQRIAWVMACQWMRFLIDWNERVKDVERSRPRI